MVNNSEKICEQCNFFDWKNEYCRSLEEETSAFEGCENFKEQKNFNIHSDDYW